MATSVCTAEDIFQLNKTKEYTLTATLLLEHLLVDNRLVGHSAKLWQILFNKSRFREDLSVRLSCAYLAELMGKSIKTIRRYLHNLEKFGYLEVKHHFLNSGGQSTSTYFVRFPKETVSKLKTETDRQKNPNELDKTDQPPLDTNDQRNSINSCYINNKPVVDKNEKEKSEQTNSPPILPSVESNTSSSEVNNLNTQLQEAQTELNNLHQQEKDDNFYSKIRKQSEKITAIEQAIEKSQHDQSKPSKKVELKQSSYTNPSGERALTTFQLNRLKKELVKYANQDKTLDVLLNEVCYSVRFGSLRKGLGSSQLLAINHAINIALKLLREGRWETPAEFKQPLMAFGKQPCRSSNSGPRSVKSHIHGD